MKSLRLVSLRSLSAPVVGVVVFVLGSTATHVIVMTIDYLTYRYHLTGQGHQDYLDLLWSPRMLPMVGAYGALSVALYLAWRRLRQLRARSREQEMHLEQQRTRIDTAQRLTGLIVERVGGENTAIRDWIFKSTQKGNSVAPCVDQASRNIGEALQALSKLSFGSPHDQLHSEKTDCIEEAYYELIRVPASAQPRD